MSLYCSDTTDTYLLILKNDTCLSCQTVSREKSWASLGILSKTLNGD